MAGNRTYSGIALNLVHHMSNPGELFRFIGRVPPNGLVKALSLQALIHTRHGPLNATY